MFFDGLTIAINGFLFFYHRFQWFLMVPDHWSNDAMVSMDRCGLGQPNPIPDPLSSALTPIATLYIAFFTAPTTRELREN